MKLLLDTHAYLWFIEGDPRIPESARHLIEHPENEISLSLASAWEVSIKTSLGKIALSRSLQDTFGAIATANGIHLLPIRIDHVLDVARLPFHHRDPFDRLLTAQSLLDDLPLISADSTFDAYGVKRHW